MNKLFERSDWHDFILSNQNSLKDEIIKIDGNRLLNTSEEDLVKYLLEKYYFDIPILQEDEISVEQNEVDIDVSGDPYRSFFDRIGPFYVKGIQINFYVPFKGEEIFFHIRPSTFYMTTYYGRIDKNCLIYTYQNTDHNVESAKSTFERYLREIKEYFSTHKKDSITYNNSLESSIRSQITSRKAKLLKDKDMVASLGYKLKGNPDISRTYAAPGIKKKISQMPTASTKPYKAEPILLNEDYESILSILENMTHIMERSPKAFKDINEEALRTHFLMQLNGQYEGNATGETFNYNGKTDILVRSQDKNIFIAECKFWKGKSQYLDTIDQILSYSSWRDTKVAILIFNRNKNLSQVIEQVKLATLEHKNFKRILNLTETTKLKYIFSHIDDPNREMILTVMIFDVPNVD